MAPTPTTLLFDCDNTLVLSEPLAFAACATLANQILSAYAPREPFRYTGPVLMHEFVGKNFRALIAALEAKHGFIVPPAEVDGWVGKELGMTISNIRRAAVPCEGVMPVLRKLQAEGRYQMVIVSSSAFPRVVASIEKTGQDAYFPRERVFSAASMDPPSSKPDPAVYLDACRHLGVNPSECIAIEDSRSGATAAMRAGIPLMGYVGPYYDEDEGGETKVEEMVRVLTEECGARVVMHHWRDFEECLKVFGA